MKKIVPKNTRKYVPCRATRTFFPRKTKYQILKGVICVRTSFHNTIVTVTDTQGQVVSWSFASACGFKGTKRCSPFVAQIATKNVVHTLVNQGLLKEEKIMLRGNGSGKEPTLQAISQSGIKINNIYEVTFVPHNGCRPPKRRRV